ncbi:MAG: AAA family ATPase [Pseudomonadota bacterium]
MRFFDRNAMRVPDIFASKQMEDAQQRVRDFLLQTEEKGQTRRVPSSEWLARDPSCREQMAKNFVHSCAYCERSATDSWADVDVGVVSRHRPDSLAQDEEGNTDFLSYVWHMYTWENTLWVCTNCIRRKGNRFYIEGKRGTPSEPINKLREQERELIMDPCWHNASEHLYFTLDGQAHWKTPQGQATIEVLGLNERDLIEARRWDVEAVLAHLNNRGGAKSAGVRVIDTGAAVPDDRFIISTKKADDTPFNLNSLNRPSYELDITHAGAVTSALLEYTRRNGSNVFDIKMLFELLFEFDPVRRDNFVNQAFAEAEGQRLEAAPDPSPLTPVPPAPAQKATRPKAKSSAAPDMERPFQSQALSRVSIENFKALKEINFKLPDVVEDIEQAPCMLLLGENATGKSSVLEAMILAMIGTEQSEKLDRLLKDEELTPADLIHRPDPSNWDATAPGMNVRLDFLDSPDHVELFAARGDKTFSGTDSSAKVILAYGPRRFFTSKRSRSLRAPAHRVKSMFDPMDVIANPIHWLSRLNRAEFETAARTLRFVLMLDEEDEFERDDSDLDRGQIFITRFGQRTALKYLSVGYKSVLAMACDVIRELLHYYDNLERAQAVVFIDEIETHLHPRWKMQIMQLLRRAFPQVQFIVTTHDPLCLQGMYNGEVFVLQRSAEDARVETVKDLPSIRGMRAEQILTSEFFGLGSTDPETDAKLERYNRLAARLEDLDATERAEMGELSKALNENMVIGSTLAEQAYAAAVQEQAEKTKVAPLQATKPQREALKSRFGSLFERPGSS